MHETLGFPRFPILSKQNFPRRRDLICIMASKATFLCSRAAPKRSFSFQDLWPSFTKANDTKGPRLYRSSTFRHVHRGSESQAAF